MDFSQFEREMIAERTRDKLHAMAQRGKRTGGWPVIGFNIDRQNHKLVVNPEEAQMAREMFDAYLRSLSLSQTAHYLNDKGYRMKEWVTHSNKRRGGQKFNKASLWYLLRNPLYIGKITHRRQILPGEHEPIISEDVFETAQKALRANGNGTKNKQVQERKHDFLLRGFIECAACNTSMTPSSALPRNRRGEQSYQRFYYYKCLSVVKMDKSACKIKHVSAKSIEEYVVKRLQLLSENQEIVERIVAESQATTSQELPIKRDERKRFTAELGKLEQQARSLVMVLADEGPNSPMRSYVREQLTEIESKKQEILPRLAAMNVEIEQLEKRQIDADVVRRNLGQFLKLFPKLSGKERQELMKLLVGRVIYDGVNSRVRIALRPLPEAWGDIDCLEGDFDDHPPPPTPNGPDGLNGSVFYDRQTSLPGSNGKQTQGLTHFNLFEPEHQDRFLAVTDRSQVDVVGRAKGRHEVHDVAAVGAIRSQQRRWKEPRTPMIQVLLRQAVEFQARLTASPGLTRDALAKEVDLNPSYLTRILNLLKLAPQIQDYICSMQPTVKIGRVTESRLKGIARIGDHGEQIRQFQRLVGEDKKLRVA